VAAGRDGCVRGVLGTASLESFSQASSLLSRFCARQAGLSMHRRAPALPPLHPPQPLQPKRLVLPVPARGFDRAAHAVFAIGVEEEFDQGFFAGFEQRAVDVDRVLEQHVGVLHAMHQHQRLF
jgi:hypothetical protein